MARNRYVLYKSRDIWSHSQTVRAKLVFERYPNMEIAYNLSDGLRKIYNQIVDPDTARLKLEH